MLDVQGGLELLNCHGGVMLIQFLIHRRLKCNICFFAFIAASDGLFIVFLVLFKQLVDFFDAIQIRKLLEFSMVPRVIILESLLGS